MGTGIRAKAISSQSHRPMGAHRPLHSAILFFLNSYIKPNSAEHPGDPALGKQLSPFSGPVSQEEWGLWHHTDLGRNPGLDELLAGGVQASHSTSPSLGFLVKHGTRACRTQSQRDDVRGHRYRPGSGLSSQHGINSSVTSVTHRHQALCCPLPPGGDTQAISYPPPS